jgi:hypothetical protein
MDIVLNEIDIQTEHFLRFACQHKQKERLLTEKETEYKKI